MYILTVHSYILTNMQQNKKPWVDSLCKQQSWNVCMCVCEVACLEFRLRRAHSWPNCRGVSWNCETCHFCINASLRYSACSGKSYVAAPAPRQAFLWKDCVGLECSGDREWHRTIIPVCWAHYKQVCRQYPKCAVKSFWRKCICGNFIAHSGRDLMIKGKVYLMIIFIFNVYILPV